ncbi:hypothetical protein FSP39_005690 [Pinctada imbricata]|uniref:Major facilitator superfamily (MFS) profile domain-containing protein n=1 Tax=Pinctada imbricata TaxID=66713 RepID=A0AA88XUF6_PINIB|nr:hypothetical protein FSP39_005690 [Pinctada imbricata]
MESDSRATQESPRVPESAEIQELPRVPDGGYGWVIVLCSFLCAFVIDGLVGSFGLIYPSLIDSLESPPALTSMIGSALIGCFLLMGIATSVLILKFGCRPVAFTGSCLATIGFVLSFFATDVWSMLVTYGMIAGVGVGLLYLPANVIVCSYFKRKLSIAQGIICSGSGVGIMAIALLTEYSLDEYGWRGTMLISAAVMIQLCVPIALMKPVVTHNTSQEHCDDLTKYDTIDKSKDKGTTLNFPLIHTANSSSHTSLPLVIGKSALPLEAASSYHSLHCIITHSNHDEFSYGRMDVKAKSKISEEPFSKSSIRSLKEVFTHSGYSHLSEKANGALPSDFDHQSNSSDDISVDSDVMPPLWRNKAFILLGVGAVLTQMAQNIPMVFLAEYGESVGVSRHQISVVLAVFGIVNTLGRLSAGLLAYTKIVSPLCICNIGIGLCALACGLLPLCTQFWSIMLFAITLGFFIGYFPPMQPLIAIHYVGIDKITSAFGALTMMKGPAAIIGPPMAGSCIQIFAL